MDPSRVFPHISLRIPRCLLKIGRDYHFTELCLFIAIGVAFHRWGGGVISVKRLLLKAPNTEFVVRRFIAEIKERKDGSTEDIQNKCTLCIYVRNSMVVHFSIFI